MMSTGLDDAENGAVAGEHNIDSKPTLGLGSPSMGSTGLSTTKLQAQEAATKGSTGQVPKPREQKEGARSKKEMNADFKELHETGSWGKLSRSEFHIVMGVIAMVVISVVVLVILFLTHVIGHKDKGHTLSPEQVLAERQELLRTVLLAIRSSNATKNTISYLPDSVSYYQDKLDGSKGYQAQALSWLLYNDDYDHNSGAVDQIRYALAAIYYAYSGAKWISATNWVTSLDFCQWYGVLCDMQGNITSLDLHSNNLVGKIPPELGLVSSLLAVNFANNHLTGTLPADTFIALPRVGIINLANNSLSGTIPKGLQKGADDDFALSKTTLSLFLNNFTGSFPYCRKIFIQEANRTFDISGLDEFQIDCVKVDCPCCDPHKNCFQP